MSGGHTPTPWEYYWRNSEINKDESDCGIFSKHGTSVVRCPRYQIKARWESDASLICRAVNAHDDLVAALKECLLVVGHKRDEALRDRIHRALAKAAQS